MQTEFAGYTIARPFPPSGMAEVYVALTPRQDRVILRCMQAQYARRRRWRKLFTDVAGVLQTLDHPHIVRFIESGMQDGTPYMVLEYVEGETLRTLMARRDELVSNHLVTILRQMAEALYYLHGQGYLHLDVKPENVLVRPDAWAVLIDFDLVTAMKRRRQRLRHLPGTYAYLPREALLTHVVDERTDIYAFGVTAYEMVTGRRPFEADTVDEARAAQADAQTQPAPPSRHAPGVPAFLERIILKCLAKEPEDRYPSMSLILKALSSRA